MSLVTCVVYMHFGTSAAVTVCCLQTLAWFSQRSRAATMPFLEDAKLLVAALPSGAFGGTSAVQESWLQFVGSVHEPQTHPVAFYVVVARALAQQMGSMSPQDYAEEHMRSMILDAIKPGSQPFVADAEGQHKEVRLTPAHVSCALLVQARARRHADTSPSASSLGIPGAHADLSAVMAQYVRAQQEVLEKDRKKGVLPYSLSTRLQDLGLTNLPEEAKPSEEALLRVEALARVARNEGRKWIGSAEGEDLQVNFRPSWTRTPALEAFVGSGSIDEKAREFGAAKKSRALHDRVDFMSFANFMGHLLDWGLKMIITKALTPVDVLSYQLILCRVSEEFGGVRTAFYYDILQRQKLAKALQNTPSIDVSTFLNKVDHDTLKDAQAKYDTKAKEAGRDNARQFAMAGKAKSRNHGSDETEARDTLRRESRSPRRSKGTHDNGKGQWGNQHRKGFQSRQSQPWGAQKGGQKGHEEKGPRQR